MAEPELSAGLNKRGILNTKSKKSVHGHEAILKESQRVTRAAVKSAKESKKKLDDIWALLNEERDRTHKLERSISALQLAYDSYKGRCLDTPGVWNILLNVMHQLGIDTEAMTSCRFFVGGVFLFRPEQMDSEDSDLRRSLRKLLVSTQRETPIDYKRVLAKVDGMMRALSPAMAITIAGKLNPDDLCANNLRRYANEASARVL